MIETNLLTLMSLALIKAQSRLARSLIISVLMLNDGEIAHAAHTRNLSDIFFRHCHPRICNAFITAAIFVGAVTIPSAQEASMLTIKSSLSPYTTTTNCAGFPSTWIAGTDCSTWSGVTCSPVGDILAWALPSSCLFGAPMLPSTQIATLTGLKSLSLSWNNFTGPLPDSFKALTGLTYLGLA